MGKVILTERLQYKISFQKTVSNRKNNAKQSIRSFNLHCFYLMLPKLLNQKKSLKVYLIFGYPCYPKKILQKL